MLHHFVLQMRLHRVRLVGRERAAAMLERALEQRHVAHPIAVGLRSVCASDGGIRQRWQRNRRRCERALHQMGVHLQRRHQHRAAERTVRAGAADLLDFATRVIVREEIAFGQMLVVDRTARILASGVGGFRGGWNAHKHEY